MAWDHYYSDGRAAYDSIAPHYDASVGRFSVSWRAKRLALDMIAGLTPPKGSLLDIGSYTGNEALDLARRGYSVLGIDISPEMVRIAREKAKKFRLDGRARFEVMRASELNALVEQGSEVFDTAYSVYGTLNLEPQLERVKRALVTLLREEGAFVCGLLNPSVLYELVVAPIALKFHGYRKLAKHGVRTRIGLGQHVVEAYLYSPKEFAEEMRPEFVATKKLGVHILYPPPRGKGVMGGKKGMDLWWAARALDAVELRIQERHPFSSLGFFSLLELRKA